MSHLHIPDGFIPPFWLLLGFILTALMLAICLRRVRGDDRARRLPRLGIVSALMLIGMSAEIAIIGYHVNLSVIAGILLGPWLGFAAAFLVNIILALFGHGGVTVIGLNTLILGAEIMVGGKIFHAFKSRFNPRASAALTTFITLALTTTLMLAIIALTQIQPALQFSGPAANAPLIQFEFGTNEIENPVAQLDLARFAALTYGFGAIGWTIEAALTSLVIGFFSRARPDLIESDARAQLAQEDYLGTRAN